MKEMEERDVDAMFVSKDVKTFEFDQELPSLPVPSLQHTLDRYLDSVRPHVTDEEYRQTEFLAQQFASGVGKELQNQLLSRAANRKNWLERWWLDYAYLDFRLPLCPPLNFVGPGPYCTHYLSARPGSQIENAGLLVHLSLNFWHIIRQERLKPDLDSKGRHMTMDQFRRLFSTCRIPAPQRDHLNAYFKTESEGPTPFHIVVQCRGRIFVIKAVDDKEEPLTPLELQDQFQKIRDQCDNQPEGLGIGALTGENRTTWAQVRSHLMAIHPDNFRHLEMVQSSIMCVILDDTSPQDETEMCQLALAGDSSNRWFDKSLTYVVFKNGLAASNCDHTPMDAMCLVVCTYYVDLQVIKCKGKWQGTKEIRKMEAPKELVFTVDNVVHRAISNAKHTYNQIANNLQVKINHFTKYGKTFLRKLKLHPDTHVQMMLQYAYYKRHGKPAPTYQTGTTRRFYNARTETVRSCTPEAIEFAKAMMDPKLTAGTKVMFYKKAAMKHNRLMAEATENKGCDRHLLGLQVLAIEGGLPMPQLYTDPSYIKSGGGGNFVLSTSFVGYTPVYGGVVPMVDHGYGTFYKIEANNITTFVSAWKSNPETDAVKFTEEVYACLEEMGELLQSREDLARL